MTNIHATPLCDNTNYAVWRTERVRTCRDTAGKHPVHEHRHSEATPLHFRNFVSDCNIAHGKH